MQITDFFFQKKIDLQRVLINIFYAYQYHFWMFYHITMQIYRIRIYFYYFFKSLFIR